MFHWVVLTKDDITVKCGLRREAYGDGSARSVFSVYPLIPRHEASVLGLTGLKMSVTAPQNSDQFVQWGKVLDRLASEGWHSVK